MLSLHRSRVLLILVTASATVSANVGYFAGAGHSVMLQKTADIQLVSEDVSIVMNPLDADYFCRFELKNLTSGAVSIQVGFPLTSDFERTRHMPRAFVEVEAPPVDETQLVADEYRFIARDAERTYHVRYVDHDSTSRFKYLLLWTMDFAPGETRTLSVSYTLTLSGTHFSADRRVWDAFLAHTESPQELMFGTDPLAQVARLSSLTYCQYVTETGASWAGTIEHATLQRLGVVASFSRPGVSDDNPYSEALFRTFVRPGT